MTTTTPLDADQVERFAGTLLATFTAGPPRSWSTWPTAPGCWSPATGPGTARAGRPGRAGRAVRPGVPGALAPAGIVELRRRRTIFALPPEHAACLTGPGAANLAPVARVGDPARRARRRGGAGVPEAAACRTRRTGRSSPR